MQTWTQPNHPFTKGQEAHAAGAQLGMNPYDPESQLVEYEHWLDGWADDQEEQRNFEALFTS